MFNFVGERRGDRRGKVPLTHPRGNLARHSSKGRGGARGGEGTSPTGGVSPCPPRTQHTGARRGGRGHGWEGRKRRGGGGERRPPRPCHQRLRARRVGGGGWEGVGRERGGGGSARDGEGAPPHRRRRWPQDPRVR
jgi:hypothetical protein